MGGALSTDKHGGSTSGKKSKSNYPKNRMPRKVQNTKDTLIGSFNVIESAKVDQIQIQPNKGVKVDVKLFSNQEVGFNPDSYPR